MKTINGTILLTKVEAEERPPKGGILLPPPIDTLVECRVKYNAETPRFSLSDDEVKVAIAYYANSKVWIRADATPLGSLGNASLYHLSDIVAEG